MLLHPDQTKQIQELVDLLKRNHLTELEIEHGGIRVRVRHEFGPAAAQGPVVTVTGGVAAGSVQPSPVQAAEPIPDATGLVTITSPIVGTFYRSPSPEADPYVEEGEIVKKGQVLCIVEAMKLMNEIESEVDGRVVKILVESAKPVEFGQSLFLIDPNTSA